MTQSLQHTMTNGTSNLRWSGAMEHGTLMLMVT
jgi:hypothetical protein